MFTPSENKIKFSDSIATKNRGRCIPVTGQAKRIYVADSTVHDANFAFLSTQLAKLHEKTYEPKVYFTYANDIPIETSGGFVDYVEYFTVDWAGIMNDTRNVMGNGVNIIPRINASMTQNRVPVYTYEIAYDLRFIELEKMKKLALAKSLEQIYQTGIRAGWDYFCQRVAYLGINNSKGLFNSDKVLVSSITNTGTTGKGFEGLDDDAVVSFFNGIFQSVLENSGMNVSLLPDTILVPTYVQSDLVSRFSALYSNSLYDFLKEHNLAKAQGGEGFKLTIAARPDLDTLGVGRHGRIVAYRKDKDYVRLDMPYPIQHYITLPNIEKSAYTSVFVGQVSEIQMPYNSTSDEQGVVMYFDFQTEA